MFFFTLGTRAINLAYLIMAERLDPDSDKVRVTMETGASFDAEGPDAGRLMDQLTLLANNPPLPSSSIITRKPDDGSGPAAVAKSGS